MTDVSAYGTQRLKYKSRGSSVLAKTAAEINRMELGELEDALSNS
jgi:hypothetical protein